MLKRSKISSGFNSVECCEDRISQLPDELLVKILSSSTTLTLKEAMQTSTISRRWKTLWTLIDGDFDFADPVILNRLKQDSSLPFLPNKRDKYIKLVNQVLASHQGLMINGLIIRFDLGYKNKSDLDACIEFAVQKKTANLLVDLSTDYIPDPNRNLYRFPVQVLSLKSNIKSLRYLNLRHVDVSESALQDILLNCTCLEVLIILGSKSLVEAKFCGELKLQLIDIRSCVNLRTVQVSAGELECLMYYGRHQSRLSICHAPKLHSLYLGDLYLYANRIPLILEVPSLYSQIETFVLDFTTSYYPIGLLPTSGLTEFKNLKCLEVKMTTDENQNMLSLISVVKAFPMLQKFVVEFKWYYSSKQRKRVGKTVEIQVLEEKLESLKEVEFKWFSGLTPDSELVMSLLENAPNVESLVFDARCPTRTIAPEDTKAARECARHLATSHSPKARLLIL